MPPPPLYPDPAARERARRPLLLKGLALSVLVHAVALALWPEVDRLAPPRQVVLLPYPEVALTMETLDPEPAPEGGGAGDPAPPLPPSIVPVPPAQERAAPPPPVVLARPAPVSAPASPTPAPATVIYPSSPLPPATAAPPADGGGGAGDGGPGSGGAGRGTGDGDGAGPGDGDGGGTGDGDGGPAPVVRDPDRAPRLVTFPLPINTAETERGALRGRARVEVLVDEEGRALDARITERLRLRRGDREEPAPSFPAAVDAAVLEAVRRLRFSPARQGDRAVRAFATVTISVGV